MQQGLIGFALGLVVAIGGIALWQHFQPPAVEGKTAPAIANLPTEDIPIKSVKAFVPAAKRKLDLPKDVQDDPAAHVTGATTVTCDERDKTVSSVLNDDGSTKMFVKQEPLPFFRTEKTTDFSLGYGFKNNTGGAVGRLGATLDLFQIKAAHLGFNSLLYSDRDYFYGVQIHIPIR